jgi:PRC-barrel domain protein
LTAKPALASTRAMPAIDVYNPLGVKIGLLQELVIDLHSGDVRYAIVLFNFRSLDATEYILPWGVLAYNASFRGFHTYVTEAQLQSAPPFDRGSAHAPEWELQLKVFYGIGFIDPNTHIE